MRARGEELGDACRVEAVLGEADRRPEPRAAGPHHHRVVRVVHHRVGRLQTKGINHGILIPPSGPRQIAGSTTSDQQADGGIRKRKVDRSSGVRRIRSRTGAVERSLEAEALALERPRETQLRHIAGGADLAAAARAREGVLEEWERGEGRAAAERDEATAGGGWQVKIVSFRLFSER